MVTIDYPGVSIEVSALLKGLGRRELVNAVRGVVEANTNRKVMVEVPGLRVDVAAVLRNLERRDLLAVVRTAVEPWPDTKEKLLQELHEFLLSRGVTSSYVHLPKIASTGQLAQTAPEDMNRLESTGGANVVLSERLLRAVRNKDVVSVRSLITAKADVDRMSSVDHSTPLGLAMLQRTPPVILKVLIDAKADVERRDPNGRTPAHLWSWALPKSNAGMREAQEKLALLLNAGAEINARITDTGDTPLHVLCQVFQSLREKVDTCTEEEQRDAQRFARGARFRVGLLLAAGANRDAANFSGRKPLENVDPRHRQELIELQATSHSLASSLSCPDLKGQRIVLDPVDIQ
jgi:hypothetical protein